MRNRGEHSFINLPRFGASLYDRMTQSRAIKAQFREIAQDLVSRVSHGRLLDIGTGPGRLLIEIHKMNSDIELFGLDVSASMIGAARKNLTGIKTDLRQGNIRSTSYESDFFDIITCTGSFYLWEYPVESLEEIFRILKEGQSAYLYETYKDFDRIELKKALRANLKNEQLLLRLITPFFLKKQLKMTYKSGEVAEIIEQTRFAGNYKLDMIILAGLPIWMRIELRKKD
jgi:ubiquinone/menaquinone biosynthesis C-methylase UbiE